MSVMTAILFYRRNEVCLHFIAIRSAQVSDRVEPHLGLKLAPAGAFHILSQPPMPSKSINLADQAPSFIILLSKFEMIYGLLGCLTTLHQWQIIYRPMKSEDD
jgi:hypothetical protein